MTLPFNALSDLTGKRVVTVERVNNADQGVRMTFDDGTVLKVRYSSCEGDILINDQEVEDAGVFTDDLSTTSKWSPSNL